MAKTLKAKAEHLKIQVQYNGESRTIQFDNYEATVEEDELAAQIIEATKGFIYDPADATRYEDTASSTIPMYNPIKLLSDMRKINGPQDKALVYCENAGLFRFDAQCIEADNNKDVIRPQELDSTQAGRWVRFVNPDHPNHDYGTISNIPVLPVLKNTYELKAIPVLNDDEWNGRKAIVQGGLVYVYNASDNHQADTLWFIAPPNKQAGDAGRWELQMDPTGFYIWANDGATRKRISVNVDNTLHVTDYNG